MKITKASLAILTLAFSGTTKTLWGVESSEKETKVLLQAPAGSSTQYREIGLQLHLAHSNFITNTKTEDKAGIRKSFIQSCESLVNWYFSHADYQLNAKESFFNKLLKEYKEQTDKDAELDAESISQLLKDHSGSKKWKESGNVDLTFVKDSRKLEVDCKNGCNNNEKLYQLAHKITKSQVLTFLFVMLAFGTENEILFDVFLSPDFSDHYIHQCQNFQTPLISFCKTISSNNDWWKIKNMDKKELARKANLINKFKINHAHSEKGGNGASTRDKTLSWVLLLQHFIKHKEKNIEPQEFPQQSLSFQSFIGITERETERLNDIFVIMTMIGLATTSYEVVKTSPMNAMHLLRKISEKFNNTEAPNAYGSMTHDAFIRHGLLNTIINENTEVRDQLISMFSKKLHNRNLIKK